jgi:hypothetical protein
MNRWTWGRIATIVGTAAGAAAVVGMLSLTLTSQITWLAEQIHGARDWHDLDAGGRASAIGQLRLALVQLTAVLGAGVALVFTAVSYRLNRRGQVTERFTKALERLDSAQMYVRIGGLIAMEQIVQDAPEQGPHTTQVLVSFIRARAPRSAAASGDDDVPLLPEEADADVQHALTVVTRPALRRHAGYSRLDLSGLYLWGADLRGADLTGADLSLADLTGATLVGADLSGASLSAADMTAADLAGANLTEAILIEVDLTEASGVEAGQLLRSWFDSITVLPPDLRLHPEIRARVEESEARFSIEAFTQHQDRGPASATVARSARSRRTRPSADPR